MIDEREQGKGEETTVDSRESTLVQLFALGIEYRSTSLPKQDQHICPILIFYTNFHRDGIDGANQGTE